MKKISRLSINFLLILLLISCNYHFPVSSESDYLDYEIIDTYPHDHNAFTQGLIFYDGYLYEGTGLKGESSLRKVELETGEIEKIHHLPDKYFGEGITILQDRIYQLTWKSNTGFVYNMKLEKIDEFRYTHDGWGLTDDGESLLVSDGSDAIYFINPESFELKNILRVRENNEPVTRINELEYIEDRIYANIWGENYIIIINPETGKVEARIDFSGIIDPDDYEQELNVLNGIAYDEINDRLFITGKLWPLIFEIKLKS